MKRQVLFIVFAVLTVLISCNNKVYTSNGENIYKRGKNLHGQSLLDKSNSEIAIFMSCQGCHGASGAWIQKCNIQWTYLTDPKKMKVPYTKELFYRFIDDDLKSDGSKARTGVHWQMTLQEKDDLIDYLKELKN